MSVHSSVFASGYSPAHADAMSYYSKQQEPRRAREDSAQVDADVRTGTKAHEVTAKHLLSFSAAVKEGVDNVIGISKQDGQARWLQISMDELPVKLPGETPWANEQVGKEHLVFLSDTRAQPSRCAQPLRPAAAPSRWALMLRPSVALLRLAHF